MIKNRVIFLTILFSASVCQASFFGLSTLLPELWKRKNTRFFPKTNKNNQQGYADHAPVPFFDPFMYSLLKYVERSRIQQDECNFLWLQNKYYSYCFNRRPYEYVASLINLLPDVEYTGDNIKNLNIRYAENQKACQNHKKYFHEIGYKHKCKEKYNEGFNLGGFLIIVYEDLLKHKTNRRDTIDVCPFLENVLEIRVKPDVDEHFKTLAEIEKLHQALKKGVNLLNSSHFSQK